MAMHPSVRSLVTAAREGGIPSTRLHRYFGISRPSLYIWLRGGTPSPENCARCEVWARAIRDAVSRGALPLPELDVDKGITDALSKFV